MHFAFYRKKKMENLCHLISRLITEIDFQEVLVDEYQDTNMLQETIVRLVKQGGEEDGNLFMVGDVKQSIYRFRLAEPMLFLGKYNRFTNG